MKRIRIIAALLALVMAGLGLSGAVPAKASSEKYTLLYKEIAPYSDVTYMEVEGIEGGKAGFDKNTGILTWVSSDVTKVVVPEEIDGVKVKAVADWAMQGCENLTEIVLPGGIETIGNGVGRSLDALTTLSMPAGVKEIGDYAFRFDEQLEKVTVGDKEIDFLYEFGDLGIKLGDYAFGDTFFLRKDFSPSYKTGKWFDALHSLDLKTGSSADYVSNMFKIANSQKGYHEGDSFDEQHGNNSKGRGDYAEYNYWWGEPGTKWCGEFAGWVIAMASVPEEIFTSKYDTPEEDTYDWKGTSYAGGTYSLKKGDVILFEYDGGNHVIIVESVSESGGKVTVNSIDGNHSNNVQNDVYEISSKTGKTTNCWTDINGHVTEIYGPDWSKLASVKFYTVKFDANGGSTSAKSKALSNGAFYGVLPIPEREGYSFDGWYTEKDGGKKITSYRKVDLTSDTTLYAHWVKGGDASSKIVIKASKASLKASDLKKKALSVTITVTGKADKISFKNATAKSLRKFVKVSKDGKVTFAKGAKKGTYKIKVTVKTGGKTVTKTIKIKVK